jgi:predicted glycosyltransferase involved in capsule biosynthesis
MVEMIYGLIRGSIWHQRKKKTPEAREKKKDIQTLKKRTKLYVTKDKHPKLQSQTIMTKMVCLNGDA